MTTQYNRFLDARVYTEMSLPKELNPVSHLWDRIVDGFLVVIALSGACVVGFRYLTPRPDPLRNATMEVPSRLVGTHLSAVSAEPFDSPRSKITFAPNTAAVILLFHPQCPHCTATGGTWGQLVDSVLPGTQVFAITTERPQVGSAWIGEVLPPRVKGFTVQTIPWDIPVVPATLVLDRRGLVAWVKLGRVYPEDLASIAGLRF